MFRITKTQTRSNTSVPFFHETSNRSAEFRQYFRTNFIETGKNLSSTRTYSEDQLTCVSVTEWESQEAFQTYITDTYCYVNYILPGQIYDLENQIISDSVTETV